jgi:anthranilate/para-aminobenzoate synthase component I
VTDVSNVTVIRALRFPPDPLLAARALKDRPGLAVLVSCARSGAWEDDARWSFVACEPEATSHDLVPPQAGTGHRPAAGWNGAAGAPQWIGVVPYEALRDIERPRWGRQPDDRSAPIVQRPVWHRYGAVVRIDHFTGHVSVEADDEGRARHLVRALERARASEPAEFRAEVLPADEPDGVHIDRVREALRLIAAGDLYEVNLARRISLSIDGDLLSFFGSLLRVAPAPWGFYQDLGAAALCASSPELALSVRGRFLRTCPIKGTRPRGRDAVEDAANASALDSDPKERAELVMAIDVHRNDLGRVAVPGSVEVVGAPRLFGGRTVWSRVADVRATRREGTTLADVARAVLPCGSVTGAPKGRAMEVIACLEASRRGAYTGAFGFVGRDGSLQLAMAIRTIQIAKVGQERSACYFAGGGIVADSIPERELEETRWKAAQLWMLSSSTSPHKPSR